MLRVRIIACVVITTVLDVEGAGGKQGKPAYLEVVSNCAGTKEECVESLNDAEGSKKKKKEMFFCGHIWAELFKQDQDVRRLSASENCTAGIDLPSIMQAPQSLCGSFDEVCKIKKRLESEDECKNCVDCDAVLQGAEQDALDEAIWEACEGADCEGMKCLKEGDRAEKVKDAVKNVVRRKLEDCKREDIDQDCQQMCNDELKARMEELAPGEDAERECEVGSEKAELAVRREEVNKCREDAADKDAKKECLKSYEEVGSAAAFAQFVLDTVSACPKGDKGRSDDCVEDTMESFGKLRATKGARKGMAKQDGLQATRECLEEGSDDDTCKGLCKDAYKVESADEESADEFCQKKALDLAKSQRNGEEIGVFPQNSLDVEVVTDDDECADGVKEKFKKKNEEVAGDEFSVDKVRCRKEAGSATYSCRVGPKKKGERDDEMLEEKADEMSEALGGADLGSERRLSLERRLAVVLEAFVAQEMALCAESDSSCINGASGSTETDSAAGHWAAPVGAAAALLQLVVSM